MNNTKIDIKSTVIGLLLGVVVMVTIGAQRQRVDQDNPIGRYQVTSSERYGFVVDTVTGQVWYGLAAQANSDPNFRDKKTP
jgi:hypothetical protein